MPTNAWGDETSPIVTEPQSGAAAAPSTNAWGDEVVTGPQGDQWWQAKQEEAPSSYDDPKDPRYNGGIYDLPVIGPALSEFSKFTGKFERGAADTASLGTADEIEAAINGFGPGTYEERLAKSRKDLADSGIPGTIGQFAGALLSPAKIAMLAGRPILGSALAGGAYGFSSGTGGLTNRGANAALGATIGGATGGALNGSLPLQSLMKKAAPFVARTAAEQTLGSMFFPIGNFAVPVATKIIEKGLSGLGKKAAAAVTSRLPSLPPASRGVIDMLKKGERMLPLMSTTPAVPNEFKGSEYEPIRKTGRRPSQGLLDYLLQ